MDTADCASSDITDNAELDFFYLFKEKDFWVPDSSNEKSVPYTQSWYKKNTKTEYLDTNPLFDLAVALYIGYPSAKNDQFKAKSLEWQNPKCIYYNIRCRLDFIQPPNDVLSFKYSASVLRVRKSTSIYWYIVFMYWSESIFCRTVPYKTPVCIE